MMNLLRVLAMSKLKTNNARLMKCWLTLHLAARWIGSFAATWDLEKTEVALRAAFATVAGDRNKEAENNVSPDTLHLIPHYQVALICPTTLLARQHYKNFKNRFAGFPVEVRQLSRMVPAKAQKTNTGGFKRRQGGYCDWHACLYLLAVWSLKIWGSSLLMKSSISVWRKKKNSKISAAMCNVLTLSATPIPRTLQMAMTGIRELSLITTPPIDRLAIRSFVMPFDPVTIREAVMRELHRGGQCFVVTPRIKDIGELKNKTSLISCLKPRSAWRTGKWRRVSWIA